MNNTIAYMKDYMSTYNNIEKAESIIPVSEKVEALKTIITSLGLDGSYFGNDNHIDIIGLKNKNLIQKKKIKNLKAQINYIEENKSNMKIRLNQSVPLYAVLFSGINFILFSIGMTLWCIYKFLGFTTIDPMALFFVNFSTLSLGLTGVISMWDWKKKNENNFTSDSKNS